MSRLHIPKPSAFIEGFNKNAGVRLRNFKSHAEFEQEVVRFIENHNMVFLATSAKSFPRCTPLGYRNAAQRCIYYSVGPVGNLPISGRIKMFPGQLPQESAAARISCGFRGFSAGEPQKSFP